jgi:hypothetical protein
MGTGARRRALSLTGLKSAGSPRGATRSSRISIMSSLGGDGFCPKRGSFQAGREKTSS